ADSIGLTLTSLAGLLSLVAVLFVFIIIIRNAIYRSRRASTRKWHIFQEPMDILMLSLFIADALQAIVKTGQFCSAQGVIQQLGEVNDATTTLYDRGIQSNRITCAVVGVVCVLVALLVLLGYESPTPYWCWIGYSHHKWRLFGEYLCRGNINFDNASWWKFTIQRADHSEGLKGIRRRSLIMLLYPAIYCCLILPLSVVRYTRVHHAATFASVITFGLSGACNAILLLTTRPESGLFSRPKHDDMGFAPSSPPLQPKASRSNINAEEEYELGRLPAR
ncbi:hypothetical protein K443DRAFT_671089, partial [Laccaria amethystina LaAM-08-1]